MSRADVVLIGAGVMGASVAWYLTTLGVRDALLVDAGAAPGAGSTGRATGGYRAQYASAINVRLSLRARTRHPSSSDLPARPGDPMRTIRTDDAPSPAGHYAQGIAHGGVVYVAGQLPKDPVWPDAPHGTVEEQVERTLRNVEAVLRAGGSGLDQLLSVTIYVTDIALWPRVNAAYAKVLGDHRPARTVVPVPALAAGYLVEIQAVGAIGETALERGPR